MKTSVAPMVEKPSRPPMKISTKRGLVVGAVFVSVAIGLVAHTGTGTLSAIGFMDIALICPVGQLETLCASRGFMLHPFLLLLAVVLITLLVGKAFCSWLCPVPYLRRFFRREEHGATGQGHADASGTLDEASRAQGSADHDLPEGAHALDPVGGARDGLHVDARHFVLAGALVSSFAFGFPVFCLICPVGLIFAVVIGVWNLFQFNAASWGLLVFPAIIVLEVVVFRRWCTTFCPIAALLSLISKGNRTFKPKVDSSACLRAKGTDCRVCVQECPEKVDPHMADIPECTKCGACADHCPAHAITFPLHASKEGEDAKPGKE